MDEEQVVSVPVKVLQRALTKARIEYVKVADRNGHDSGPDKECWAEFESLAQYLPAGVSSWRYE